MRYLFILTGIFLSVSLFAQDTLTVQPNAVEGKDAVIGPVFDINHGYDKEIVALTWSCDMIGLCLWRSLIQFDLSGIPAEKNISSAHLFLYAKKNSIYGFEQTPHYGTDNAAVLKRITESWWESTVTWNNQPAVTNVNQVTLPQSDSATQDYDVDVTQLVIDMLQTNNYGFMLMEKNETEYLNRMIFYSSDDTTASKRPKLTITYSDRVEISTGIDKINTPAVSVAVYPNPMDDYTNINVSSSTGKEYELIISNIIGQHIKSMTGIAGNILQINRSDLSSGLYIYEVKMNGVRVAQGKIAVR